MGYEYDAIADDAGDYLRRRERLLREAAALPSFRRQAGPHEIWLSDPAGPADGWDEVQLLFGEARVRLTCMRPLSPAVRADLRELLRLIGGAGQARYVDDDGEPAQFW
ncbi:hypothetical protein [Lysobacter sp. TAB13]|uniref:hypothetical protein n=1 Tax=Lysobacter sp. TAB13 TaxID=3233065 RepID=UPI003F9D9580